MVVEPTHLKNMKVKLGSSSPNRRGENKTYLSCHYLVAGFFQMFNFYIGFVSGPFTWVPLALVLTQPSISTSLSPPWSAPVKYRANGHSRIFWRMFFLGQIGVVRYDIYIYNMLLYVYSWYIRICMYMYYHHNELLCSAFATPRKQHTRNFEWNMWKKQLLGVWMLESHVKGSAQHG